MVTKLCVNCKLARRTVCQSFFKLSQFLDRVISDVELHIHLGISF